MKTVMKENVHYKGELRIIGTIRDKFNVKSDILGYMITNEKAFKFYMTYTVEQVKTLIREGITFSNAKLNDNEIEFTECSVNALPIFDRFLRLQETDTNTYITILGEISLIENITNTSINKDKLNKIGMKYKLLVLNKASNAKNNTIVEMTEAELINLMKKNSNTVLVNGKLVQRDNKVYVSAIKGEFTTIIRCKEVVNNNNSKVNTSTNNNKQEQILREQEQVKKAEQERIINRKKQLYRNLKHKKKLIEWAKLVIHLSIGNYKGRSYFSYYHLVMNKDLHKETGLVEFKKNIQILYKEVLNDLIITNKDKEIIANISSKLKASTLVPTRRNTTTKVRNDDILVALAFSQFILNDMDIYLELLSHRDIVNLEEVNTEKLEQLQELGLASEHYKRFIKDLKLQKENNNRLLNIYELFDGEERDENYNHFTGELLKFKDASACAELGFTLNGLDEDKEYTTKAKENYKLKYVGKYLEDFKTYKQMMNCLGDVLILAQIERTIDIGNRFCESEAEIEARVEIMLAILALNNPKIAKEYLKNNGENLKSEMYNTKDIEFIPGINLDKHRKVRMSEALKVYYASGFNVFLSDDGLKSNYVERQDTYIRTKKYKKYKNNRYKTEGYINYRSTPLYNYCQHPLLYTELKDLIMPITSDRVTSELYDRVIGGLRVL